MIQGVLLLFHNHYSDALFKERLRFTAVVSMRFMAEEMLQCKSNKINFEAQNIALRILGSIDAQMNLFQNTQCNIIFEVKRVSNKSIKLQTYLRLKETQASIFLLIMQMKIK